MSFVAVWRWLRACKQQAVKATTSECVHELPKLKWMLFMKLGTWLLKCKSSELVLAPKFKYIRSTFSAIKTPFSVNAQLHLCSTVWVLSSKTFPFHFKFPKGWRIISWCERRELHICSKLSTKLLDYKNSQWFLK